MPPHWTVLLVAEPLIVHVGSPFFLKCGLAASAAVAVAPNASTTVTAMSVRRISPSLMAFRDPLERELARIAADRRTES